MVRPLLLTLQFDADDPPGRLAQWLTEAGLDLDVRDLSTGAGLPDDVHEHAGLLLLGGAIGAHDDVVAPFLPAVRGLLREAVAEEIPTLGVCLGHQLLAAAHGGVVRRSPSGPEIGVGLVAKRTAASFDPLFGSMPITPDVVQWHFDEVATLPPGAIQLYSAPACAQQAFRLGRLAWGIQFHIETTPEIVRRWADSDAGVLSDWDLDAVIAGVDAIDDDLVEVWQPFAADFARVVAEPAAVPAPRRMATASTAPLTDPAAIRAALAAEATGSRHPSGIPLGMPSPRTASSD